MASIFGDIQVNLSGDFTEFLEKNLLKDELKKVCDESKCVMTAGDDNGIKIQGNLVSILNVHKKLDELREVRAKIEGNASSEVTADATHSENEKGLEVEVIEERVDETIDEIQEVPVEMELEEKTLTKDGVDFPKTDVEGEIVVPETEERVCAELDELPENLAEIEEKKSPVAIELVGEPLLQPQDERVVVDSEDGKNIEKLPDKLPVIHSDTEEKTLTGIGEKEQDSVVEGELEISKTEEEVCKKSDKPHECVEIKATSEVDVPEQDVSSGLEITETEDSVSLELQETELGGDLAPDHEINPGLEVSEAVDEAVSVAHQETDHANDLVTEHEINNQQEISEIVDGTGSLEVPETHLGSDLDSGHEVNSGLEDSEIADRAVSVKHQETDLVDDPSTEHDSNIALAISKIEYGAVSVEHQETDPESDLKTEHVVKSGLDISEAVDKVVSVEHQENDLVGDLRTELVVNTGLEMSKTAERAVSFEHRETDLEDDSDMQESSLQKHSIKLKDCYVSLTRLKLKSIAKLAAASSSVSEIDNCLETGDSVVEDEEEKTEHANSSMSGPAGETKYTLRSGTGRSPRRRWNKEAIDSLLHAVRKPKLVKEEPQLEPPPEPQPEPQTLLQSFKRRKIEQQNLKEKKSTKMKLKVRLTENKQKTRNIKKKEILYVKTQKRKPSTPLNKTAKKAKLNKDRSSPKKVREPLKTEKVVTDTFEDIIYKCEYCTYENLRKSNLTEHVRRAHKLDQYNVYREFPCDVCGKIFGYERDVRRHQMLRHNRIDLNVTKTEIADVDESGIKVKCEYCNFTAVKPSSMKEHTRRCHPEFCDKKFQCDECGRMFGYTRDLNRHIMTHRAKALKLMNRPTEFKCQYCDYVAKKQTNLSEHVRRAHYEITQRVFECQECDKKFGFKKDLGRHEKTHERKRERIARKLATIYSCNYCTYIGKSQSHLNAHVRRKHIDITKKEFPCTVCDKKFGYPKELKRHMVRHEDPTVMCEECGAMFKCQRTLKYHLSTSHNPEGATRYPCTLCDKSFSQEGYLNGHIKKVHLGIRDVFLCQICGKSFLKKISYVNHTNVHLGKKPFVCEVCGKSFAYQKSIIEHRYIHSNLKPFHCTTCSKSFRFASGLYKHRKNRHGAFQSQKGHICRTCGKCFSDKNSLHIHEKVHRGFEPWLCKFCGLSFKSSSSSRRHLILTHSIDPEDCEKHMKKILYSSSGTGRFIEEVNPNDLTEDFFKTLKNPLKFNAIPSKDAPLPVLENEDTPESEESDEESDDDSSRQSTNNFIIEIPKSTFSKMQSLEKIKISRKEKVPSASENRALEKELMEMACAAATANVLKPANRNPNEGDEEEESMDWQVAKGPSKTVAISDQNIETNTIQLQVTKNGIPDTESDVEPSTSAEVPTMSTSDVTMRDESTTTEDDHQFYSVQPDAGATATETVFVKKSEPDEMMKSEEVVSDVAVSQTQDAVQSHHQNNLDRTIQRLHAEISDDRVAEAAKVLTILNEECSRPPINTEPIVEPAQEEVQLVQVSAGAEHLLTESILAANALQGDHVIAYQSDDIPIESNEECVQHIVYTTDGVIGTSNSQEIILSEANIDGQVVYIVSGDIEGLT